MSQEVHSELLLLLPLFDQSTLSWIKVRGWWWVVGPWDFSVSPSPFVKLRSRSRSVEGQVRVRKVRTVRFGPELYNIFGFHHHHPPQTFLAPTRSPRRGDVVRACVCPCVCPCVRVSLSSNNEV